MAVINTSAMALGLLTLILIVALDRTRLGPLSLLVALVVAAVLVPLLGWDSVSLVGDISEIPRSLPSLTLPSLVLVRQLLLSAVAIGLIGLV